VSNVFSTVVLIGNTVNKYGRMFQFVWDPVFVLWPLWNFKTRILTQRNNLELSQKTSLCEREV